MPTQEVDGVMLTRWASKEHWVNMFVAGRVDCPQLDAACARARERIMQAVRRAIRLEEDEMMASLRTQSKELHRHLSKLTTKSEVVPCPECPVCYESLQPPAKILQCVSGHLTCLPCASKMERFDCPMCKQDFTGRAIAMEQFLRTLFHAE